MFNWFKRKENGQWDIRTGGLRASGKYDQEKDSTELHLSLEVFQVHISTTNAF